MTFSAWWLKACMLHCLENLVEKATFSSLHFSNQYLMSTVWNWTALIDLMTRNNRQFCWRSECRRSLPSSLFPLLLSQSLLSYVPLSQSWESQMRSFQCLTYISQSRMLHIYCTTLFLYVAVWLSKVRSTASLRMGWLLPEANFGGQLPVEIFLFCQLLCIFSTNMHL